MSRFQIRHGFALLILISLLVALQSQGCAAATPELVVRTVEVTRIAVPSSIPLSLNPSKTILSPGEQVVISVIPEEWQAAELTWELASKDLSVPGTLSASTGPTVVYTAPEGSGEVNISVRGRTKEGVGSASISFSIKPRPMGGVVEFWTSPFRLDLDSERAREFSKVYPDVWVKIVSLPPEEAQAKSLTAIAAGVPPDVVLLPWEDAQVFGKKGFLDADATTWIIREIGEEKFAPESLKVLFNPDDKTWTAIPAKYGTLGIMTGSANKSAAEAWVKFLIEKEIEER